MAVDLKSATPDTSLPKTGFVFGADSQAAAAPSVYPLSALAQTLLGGTSLSGDTVTANSPMLDLTQTWNNAGTLFVGMRYHFTDTASNASSLIFDYQVGFLSKLKLDKSGTLTIGNHCYALGSIVTYNNMWTADNAGAFIMGASQDVRLMRDAANALALRNGAAAQSFAVYNTFTDASNYERLGVRWSSNVAYLGPQKAGTGSDRLMVVQTGIVTVAALPSASTAGAGARAMVSDATVTTFASTVAGGGANKVPVVSDGTNWLIG